MNLRQVSVDRNEGAKSSPLNHLKIIYLNTLQLYCSKIECIRYYY